MTTRHGHPKFYELIEKMATTHSAKNKDYGGGNVLGNFFECLKFGGDPFMGVLYRMSDKWSRICSLVKTKEQAVKDESLYDTLLDLAVYSLLAIIIRQEWELEKEGEKIKDASERS